VSDPAEIRAAFTAAAAAVNGVAHALDYEPDELPPLTDGPCVTMLQRQFRPQVVQTGGVIQVTFIWTVAVYALLRDYQTAQAELEAVIPRLVLITVADTTLDETCDQAELVDPGQEPFPEDSGGVATMTKLLQLSAIGEMWP
jgi:hypothetical protein